MPKQTIMSTISDKEFIEIVKNSISLKEVATKCGYSNFSGASSNIVKKRIEVLNIPIKHFSRSTPIIRTDEEIFIEDSPVDQSTLRRRYLSGNFSEYKCSICGQLPIWNNQELVLTLDHINGHNHDDRLENLRWVCPNCDRQLDTFGGKNITSESKKNFCIDCGIEILQSSTRCVECASKFNGQQRRKVERPTREELKAMIRIKSFVQLGKDFNISDNAIRKWCDEYSLPRTKKIIQKFSEEEWNKI